MQLSRYEQETIVNFNEAEKTAGVYTHNKSLMKKLQQLSEKFPEDCRLEKVSHDGEAVDYIIPKSWIKIRAPRQLSEAQKEALKKARFTLNSTAHAEDADIEPVAEGNYIPAQERSS